MNACSWCRRQTRLGRAFGFELLGDALASATRSPCVECAEKYEDVLTRMRNEHAETISIAEERHVRGV
jgi:hypothetical protein